MNGETLARIGAVIFVGVAITATAIEMTRPPQEPAPAPVETVREHGDEDILRRLLRQCRDRGEAATRDPACLRAWAENRRRFLKQGSVTGIPASDAPTTLWPSTSAPADNPVRKESAPADTSVIQPEPVRPITPQDEVR